MAGGWWVGVCLLRRKTLAAVAGGKEGRLEKV